MKAFSTSVRFRGPAVPKPAKADLLSSFSAQRRFCDALHANDIAASDLRDQTTPMGDIHALQEPLLGSTAADSTHLGVHSVTCNGVKGTLTIFKDGGIRFKSLEVRHAG